MVQQCLLGHEGAGLERAHRFGHMEEPPALHPHAPARQAAVGKLPVQVAEAEMGQGLQAAGHQRLAAELAAEACAGFHQRHRLTAARQLQRQAEAGRAGTHHEEAVHVMHA